MEIKLTNNFRLVGQRMAKAKERALERIGMQAESFAVDLVPVDTGALKNSITHKVDTAEDCVYIGTNMEYAVYVELGTGIYAEGGGGRPTPWVYQDDNGDWHYTHGQKPQPYLRPAANDHKKTWANIVEDEMKNG